jgi:peptidoglycan biosynthesis protein MviN/MurJ (putative lipid II flippase)
VRTPALIGLGSIALNALLAYLLMRPLHNLGIALATSLVSLYNFIFLYILFKRRIGYRISKGTRQTLVRAVLAGVAIALICFGVRKAFGAQVYAALAVSLAASAALYGILFKNYYLRYLKRERG